MKFKLNDMEKKWILYDVGNSAFTLLIATIMPIYFNYLADQAGISEVNYLAYWGYATSAATIIVAVLGPVLGAASDKRTPEKNIPGFSSDWSFRLCFSWIHSVLDLVSAAFCNCKISLLFKPGCV